MVLHIEQHQAAVTEWINGAQDKGCHQGGKEGAPQGLEREVVAYLEDRRQMINYRLPVKFQQFPVIIM